jgi:hypothetical protein
LVKPLYRVAVSFPLSVVSLGVLSAIIALQPPRTITGVLLSYLFPVVALGFGCFFVVAFSRVFEFPKRPIARFALPVIAALFLLICAVWLAVQIGALARHAA